MSEHGRVLAVNRVRLGSELSGDHAAAVTVLAIEDGADFDENGGWLEVGDQVVAYTERVDLDDDTAELTLADPLEDAADDGDPVLLWDKSRDVQASEVYAEVELDGEAGGDPIQAIVAHHLVNELPEGIRSLVGESVRMEEDGDDWIVVDVLGISESAGAKWEDDDPHTLTSDEITAGAFAHTLLHTGIVEHHEFVATVNGVALGPDRYVLAADDGAVTVTLSGWETVEDSFRFHYAYRHGPSRSRRTLLPYRSAGWSKLQITKSDTVDRSGVSFDDSAWTVSAAPFGQEGGGTPADPSWPDVVTAWATETALWLRRDLAASAGERVTVNARIDDYIELYWNGDLIGTGGDKVGGGYVGTVDFEVPADQVLADNVLAVRAADKDVFSAGGETYVDVEVIQ